MDSNNAAEYVSALKKQLHRAEQGLEVCQKIEAARCPLCGGELKPKSHRSEQFFTIYISASIRCSKCGVFGADVMLKDELSCHCKGYNELTALEDAWSKISKYIK